jgi:hypothetical protein
MREGTAWPLQVVCAEGILFFGAAYLCPLQMVAYLGSAGHGVPFVLGQALAASLAGDAAGANLARSPEGIKRTQMVAYPG